MRRIAAALLAALLILSLAGCGLLTARPGQTQTIQQDTTQAPETQAPETQIPDTQAPDTQAPDTQAPGEDLFRFTRENFPRLDGSTALVPLGEAAASVLLGESRDQVQDLVQFNRTTQSFRNLMNGECDLLLAGEPNAAVFDEMAEQNFEIDMEVIGTDGLVFLVNENNPVQSLTTQQIRDIYTGKITNWSQVGGEDAEIIPFQRNEGAGSQALMKKLVMGDTPMMEAPEDYMATSMGELMAVVKSYDNSANAIGYSVYYYAHDMEMARGLKLLRVDDVEPNRDTIRSGAYPHVNAYYCVIPAAAPAGSPNRVLYEWLLTDEGQALVAGEGYVSVR